MAIIVDKVQKRKDIALSCKEIFFQNGINDLTISQIAKTAGVGKGTIYEYFKNKEDIIFEIVNILIQERNVLVKKRISEQKTTRDKIRQFSRFFYSDEDKDLRELYKEFISISLVNQDKEMKAFQTTCADTYLKWFESILKEGIDKKELKLGSEKLIKGMFAMTEGVFIKSIVTSSVEDIEKEILQFQDAIFDLIEEKK